MHKFVLIGASLLALVPQTSFAQEEPTAPETAAPASAPAPMSASAAGSARKGPERRLTGADLFDLSIASDPQLSPTGATSPMSAARTTS